MLVVHEPHTGRTAPLNRYSPPTGGVGEQRHRLPVARKLLHLVDAVERRRRAEIACIGTRLRGIVKSAGRRLQPLLDRAFRETLRLSRQPEIDFGVSSLGIYLGFVSIMSFP